MDLQKAMDLLNECTRSELRDHAFGDVEVTWYKGGQFVASGYFGLDESEVDIAASIVHEREEFTFTGELADRLRNCGTLGEVDRNDETGPDAFVEGQTMPGLTLDGVPKWTLTIARKISHLHPSLVHQSRQHQSH